MEEGGSGAPEGGGRAGCFWRYSLIKEKRVQGAVWGGLFFSIRIKRRGRGREGKRCKGIVYARADDRRREGGLE